MLCGRDHQARGDGAMTIQHIEPNHDGDGHDAGHNLFLQMSLVHERDQVSFSPGSWIAFIHPVRAEIVRDVKHPDIAETHRTQCIVGRLDVRTMAPRTTSAINNDEFVSRERFNALAQLLDTARTGGRSDVFRARDMRLRVEHMGTDLNHQWLFALG